MTAKFYLTKIFRTALMGCVLAFALCSTSAFAESAVTDEAVTGAIPASDLKTVDAAKELIRLMIRRDQKLNDLDKETDVGFTQMVLKVNPHKEKIVQEVMSQYFVAPWDTYKDEYAEMRAPAIASQFSYDELQAVMQFMNSPAAKKLDLKVPSALRDWQKDRDDTSLSKLLVQNGFSDDEVKAIITFIHSSGYEKIMKFPTPSEAEQKTIVCFRTKTMAEILNRLIVGLQQANLEVPSYINEQSKHSLPSVCAENEKSSP